MTETPVLPRCDSADSNLSYISASHSLDDTFVTQDALEDVKESLTSLLTKYRADLTDTYNTSGLITLLAECLDESNREVENWKRNCLEKDSEIADLRTTYDEKLDKILDENRERISSIISSNEKQLSTALERAVNSRRQTETLQIQLNEARSKIFAFEQRSSDNYLSLISDNQSKAEQYFEEKIHFLNKITLLEDEANELRQTVEKLSLGNDVLNDKLRNQTQDKSEILNESENALKCIQSQLNSTENELLEERKLNKTLLDENNSCTRENAVLKAKLELAVKDSEHRDKMISILKSEKRELTENLEKSSLNYSKYSSLMEEIASSDKEIDQLLETLNEKLKMKVNIANQLLEVENSLKKKSVEIQMNSDRVANFNRRLKQLDEELSNTSDALKSREKQIKSLERKLESREIQLDNLSRKAQDGRAKISELDNSLKLSLERERKLSERLRSARNEEARLENDVTVHQNRSESLLKVLQSRKNIIHQLEHEGERSDARLLELFDKTLPAMTSETTLSNESRRLSGSFGGGGDNFSGIGVLNNSSLTSVSSTDSNRWHRANDANYDSIEMSLSECLTDNIVFNRTVNNNSDMECTVNKEDKEIVLGQNPAKTENELPSLSPSDTDSGISFLTANQENLKQSTPFPSNSSSFKKEELSPVESSDKYSLNLTSRPAAVSINIYQATGRVRHNSLPSSAAKNRPRYKTKFQECLPASTLFPTQEQSSQTATSSFIESYKSHRQTEQFERLPADGLEPLQNK